jgi:DNA-binding beta-propeller fold protein YncE
MADVTRTIHVRLRTFDPVQSNFIPVPQARLRCKNSEWLRDPSLSGGNDVTDAQGRASVAITFKEEDENSLNPYFEITIPAAARAVPAGVPANQQLTLPGEWTTRHYVNRRIPRITNHTNPNTPLDLFVDVHGHLRVGYRDFLAAVARNPMALPTDSARVYLADYDEFLFIDFLNPDDTLRGFGVDSSTTPPRSRRVGQTDEYPYYDLFPTAPAAFDGLPATPRAWIDPPGQPVGNLGGGSFEQVGAVAVDAHGFVFVVDGDVVLRFYPDGTLCETIPDPAEGITLNAPEGLALDTFRHLFVADTGNNRIVVFRLSGVEGDSGRYEHVTGLSPFGSAGSGTGQFDHPRGLEVVLNKVIDGGELLAVVDAGNHRVQVFRIAVSGSGSASPRASAVPRPALSFLAEFGAAGTGAGQFDQPTDIAADTQGRVYVCDRTTHRVTRWALNTAGTTYIHERQFVKRGGGAGAGDGEFDQPVGIAVDRHADLLYVAEAGNRRVQRLEPSTGVHLAHWSHTYAPPLANPFTPGGLAVDARGELSVGDSANERVLRFSRFPANGSATAVGDAPRLIGEPWTPRGSAPHMRRPAYVTFAPDGKLWASDSGNNRVVVFERNAARELVAAAAPDPAGFDNPVGIAFDPEGNVFIVDSGNHRIRRYDSALAHQSDFGTHGSGATEFDDPRGIAIGQRVEPILYVADRDNNRVRKVRRDGGDAGAIGTAGGTAFDHPEDVAVDNDGNVYIADTGNQRIVQLDATDAFVRAITLSAHGQSFANPCGVAVDPDGKLLVTDRTRNMVYRMEADGTLQAFWNLTNLLLQEVGPPTVIYQPELARMLTLDRPTRAAIDRTGLLAIADTNHDRIRLVRIHTDLHVNLDFEDLGIGLFEGLPDLSLRLVTKADWNDELGLKVNVGDVSIFDESQDFASSPIDGFADDEYDQQHIIGPSNSTNAAINVLRVVRTVQRWYQHHTRGDEAAHRWGTAATARTLNVDLIGSEGSYQFLDVNMGEKSPHGRGSDAWDDSVIAHEMTHWAFFKNTHPNPPFSLVGLIGLSRSHSLATLGSFNQALTEGWANYVESFWGSEFSTTDRLRGYKMVPSSELTGIAPRGQEGSVSAYQWLFGGPQSANLPTFTEPGRGLRNEGYFANTLYQVHRALTDPEVIFADGSGYWYRFNVNISDEQSQRYSQTIWQALRMFSADPPLSDFDEASRVYMTNVLRQFRTVQTGFAEIAQTIMELNNQLMPRVTIAEGTSATTAGAALGDSLAVREGELKSFIVRVADATGSPLAGYVVQLDVGGSTDFSFSPPGAGPQAHHGRVTTGTPHRATDTDGVVVVTYQAPPLSGASTSATATLRAVYQPDFDVDAALAPPARGDDLETLLRKHYLYSLRGAAKAWRGAGNFGARVQRNLTLNIQRRAQAAAGQYSGRIEDRASVPEDARGASSHAFLGAGQAFEVVDRAGGVVASGTLDATGRFNVALPAGQWFELRLSGLTGLRT